MKKFKRIFLIVMDSFGAGHAKDGAAYGDDGADTMGHIAEKHDNWKIPNLTKLGLANLHPLKGVTPAEHPLGYQLRKRHYDRTLGNDGYLYHKAIRYIYRPWFPT